ncbi:MAG: hypothetical protein KZQ64_10875 [gamma proteobacterium symbiont of Bathyaustriella thionipta]|nr:hypothetical protein [gamma proteobacterium symbiont of Bathyaustriella thionipta]MCU7948700.1 hypothetical protein [gamma proteobacterium symbiont of Bathyaustriella thionipta]MCU7953877.1 hypothetical protein [gamma proteobacterium symbiont of Bathyaustriella thionipta]MCU7955027.1 hypothetical protein [gamma proteobacterium symbiont of Bathyaustriella thionipta]MCU7968639.1 hypothetical protein [gamma proteobacterium symbiont of Bathyaustriella thionipta]
MVVFYFPYDTKGIHNKPGRIRPVKLLEAFKKKYGKNNIIEVTGKERNETFETVYQYFDINDIDFVYIESINKPLLLQNLFEGKINLLSDYMFFWKCKKNNIPLCYFYRDAHWLEEHFKESVPFFIYPFLKLLFYLEFKLFESMFDILFLPSIEMKSVLPLSGDKLNVSELPPAADNIQFKLNKHKKNDKNIISLIYVGNISPALYNINPVIKVVKNSDKLHLNLCCRKEDWEKYKSAYSLDNMDNLSIYHVDSEDLAEIYKKSDIHLLYYEQNPYRNFAVPFKFYESLQFGIPFITNIGTKVASMVTKLDVGWVVNDIKEMDNLLLKIANNKKQIEEKKINILKSLDSNTWDFRVEQIGNEVLSFKTKPDSITR